MHAWETRIGSVARCLSLLVICVGFGLGLQGCGSGISSAIPSAGSKTAPGVPGGPMIGYVWSASDAALRPMLGVVGSGLVGQSIVPPGTYVAGAATSASEIGLVEDEAGSLYLLELPTPTVTQIATGLPVPAQISFSPLGTWAVAYAPGGTSVTVISGLTGQTTVSTMTAPAALAAAIVSDAGTVLAATQSAPARVGTLSGGGQFGQVASVGALGGMSFLAGVDDALLADAGASTVSRLSKVSGSAVVQGLGSTGVNKPVAVANSRDGHWGLVVNGGDASVIRIDLTGGTANTKVACACQPNGASLLHGGKAFRLNDLSSGPVWIADLSGTAPQMVFVPAIH